MRVHYYRFIALFLFILNAAGFAQEDAAGAPSSLRDLAAARNLIIGTSAGRGCFNNPLFVERAAREFNSLTPENELKCASVSGGPDSYFFFAPDYMVKWAEEHGMKVRGHTLVWHQSVPRWLKNSNMSKDEMLSFLHNYITTVVSRYKGRIYAWDVVNEVLEENGRLRSGTGSFWHTACGEEYIENAFRWARAADPNAKLFINDYGVETINQKSNGLYDLVKQLLARRVPIDGVGLQCHFREEAPPDFSSMAENVKRFIALGLEVQFTELDIRIRGEPTPEQLRRQAEMYAAFFRLALSHPQITGVTLWGASDAVSWIPGAYKGYGAALLFDERFEPKPAYAAVKEVLTRNRSKKE